MGTHPIFESDFDCLTDGHFGMSKDDPFVHLKKFELSPANKIVRRNGEVVFNIPPVIEPFSNLVMFPETTIETTKNASLFDKIIKLTWKHGNLIAFRNIFASGVNPDLSLFRWCEKETMGPDVEPSTPLIRFIINRFHLKQGPIFLKTLLDYGADPNFLFEGREVGEFPGCLGNSNVHRAVQLGHYKAVKLLIEAGADFSEVDRMGKKPLQTAVESGDLRIIEYLQSQETIWKMKAGKENLKLKRHPCYLNMHLFDNIIGCSGIEDKYYREPSSSEEAIYAGKKYFPADRTPRRKICNNDTSICSIASRQSRLAKKSFTSCLRIDNDEIEDTRVVIDDAKEQSSAPNQDDESEESLEVEYAQHHSFSSILKPFRNKERSTERTYFGRYIRFSPRITVKDFFYEREEEIIRFYQLEEHQMLRRRLDAEKPLKKKKLSEKKHRHHENLKAILNEANMHWDFDIEDPSQEYWEGLNWDSFNDRPYPYPNYIAINRAIEADSVNDLAELNEKVAVSSDIEISEDLEPMDDFGSCSSDDECSGEKATLNTIEDSYLLDLD